MYLKLYPLNILQRKSILWKCLLIHLLSIQIFLVEFFFFFSQKFVSCYFLNFIVKTHSIYLCKSKTLVTSYEFKFTSYELKFMSCKFKSTSCEFKPTSWKHKITSYMIKSTSQEIKSMSWSNKTNTYIANVRVKRENSEFKILNFTSYKKFYFYCLANAQRKPHTNVLKNLLYNMTLRKHIWSQ